MKPNKVLVIDDSRLLHKMYGVMLQDLVLVHAFDGIEALQRLAEHRDVDLILLDINMPHMNGLELLNLVRSNQSFAKIPVIIISTETKDEDRARGVRAGANAYLKKPFSHDELRATIEGL